MKKKAKKSVDEEEDEELVQAQDSDAEEGDDYHMEKLRQYQLNRLRYFYAVMECDSVETADKIYKECDGIEYESSATRVDLRFIPDDTSFDEDTPTDICTELPDASSYKPRQFTTTALQQVKVDLTWDETAVERRELGDKLASGKLDEVNDRDLRQIVAYSSEEDDDDDDNNDEYTDNIDNEAEKTQEESTEKSIKSKKTKGIDKYKALLAEINEKEDKNKNKNFEMELTWEVNEKKDEVHNVSDDTHDEQKENNKIKENLTPIEKVLIKRQEKNKKRKEERKRKLLLAKGIDPDEHEEESDLDSLPDGVDMNDPYFAEEFANGDFAAPKTKKKINKKEKRKSQMEENVEDQKQAEELALLLEDSEVTGTNEKQHFSLEKIIKAEQETKSKRKRRKQLKKSKTGIEGERKELEDNFEINVEDDRFKSLYTSHLFNIDPSDSHFKKTKGMEKLIQEKLKRRAEQETMLDELQEQNLVASKRPKKHLENNLLVKNLRRKLQQQKS